MLTNSESDNCETVTDGQSKASSNMPAADDNTEESNKKSLHITNLDTSESLPLHRCMVQDCCSNMVHCPFCHVSQFKPTQPARVRDHLHRTHFQHAVYYDGLMIVKCFHDCRGPKIKGGHYHCPACSATLLKRNAFTQHLRAHADWEGHDGSTVQAPDSKHPAFIFYQDYKIPLCREKCSDTLEAHYHCPLCQRTSPHLAALTAHLWRCKKRAVTVQKFGDDTETTSTAELFSPALVKSVCHPKDMPNFKWHLSIVRNLSDLPMTRCTQDGCCKGRYHCPLCTTTKLKPNHLCHMRQHFVSHWRSGIPFGDYTVLVCYLPCEARHGTERVRFHYHCPLCGGTRRRKEAMTSHLVNCDPQQLQDMTGQHDIENDDVCDDDDDAMLEFSALSDSLDGSIIVTPASSVPQRMMASVSRQNSADQAELQAAESLVDMDRILKQSARQQLIPVSQAPFSSDSLKEICTPSVHITNHREEPENDVFCQRTVVKEEEGSGNESRSQSAETQESGTGEDQNVNITVRRDENGEMLQEGKTLSQDLPLSSENPSQEQASVGRDPNSTEEVTSPVSQGESEGDANTCAGDGDRVSTQVDAEDDELQVFQQVTTQVSKQIVTELQQHAELDECLQAVGRVCGVSWQQSGDSVSMTSHLDDLCHAQNCLRQILKEGLQSFLQSPPTKAPLSKSSSAKSPSVKPLLSSQAESAGTAIKSGRKRGRPCGSKNKQIHFTRENEDYTPAKKISRLLPSQGDTNSHGSHSTEEVDASNVSREDYSRVLGDNSERRSSSGHYGIRTRGKKINFAQLNAGSASPIHEEDEDTPPPPPTPEEGAKIKRGRGRPRKSNVEIPIISLAARPTITADQQFSGNFSNPISKTNAVSKFENNVDGNIMSCGLTAMDGEGVEKQNGSEISMSSTSGKQDLHSSSNTGDCKNTSAPNILSGAEEASKQETSATAVGESYISPKQVQEPASEELPSKLTQTPVTSNHDNSPDQGKDSRETYHSSDVAGYQSVQHGRYSAKGGSRRKYGGGARRGDFAVIPTIVFDYSAQDGANDQSEEAENESKQEIVVHMDGSVEVAKPLSSLQKRIHENEDAINSSTDRPFDKYSKNATEDLKNSGIGEGEKESDAAEAERGNTEQDNIQTSLTCPLCPVTMETYSEIRNHLSSVHPTSPQLTCDVCEVAYLTPNALLLHIECRHGPHLPIQFSGAYICPTCNKVCSSASSLRWHRSFIHKQSKTRQRIPQKLQCTLCSYQAADPWDMRHHRERHRDHPAVCPVCNKVLSTENAVKVHVAAVHSNTSFACPTCSKVFAHVRYLRSHMRRHSGIKRHQCSICGWRFHETNTLRAHMDTHKPRSQRTYAFRCPFCPASYNSRANYRDHLNKHTGERPHVCQKCGRGFAFRSMLATHIAFVHSDERPYVCSDCPKTFKTKQQLRQHSLFHTGNSPHICGKCGRAMVSNSRLKAHAKRCKGSNLAQKPVVIRQPISVVTGPNLKLQTIQLLPRETVSVLQAGDIGVPLVSLLQDRQFTIVQNIQGKQAVLTLLPLQNVVTQDRGQVGIDNQQAVKLYSSGTVVSQALGTTDSSSLNQSVELGAVKPSGDAIFFTYPSSADGGVPSSGVAELESGEENNLTGVDFDDQSGQNIPGTSFGQSITYVTGQTCTQESQGSEQPSSSIDTKLISLVSKNAISQETGVDFSREISHIADNPSISLQESGSQDQLVNISVGDSGETHTFFLPPDLIKQEVLIIENEDGQQSLINLANVQVIQTDNADSIMGPKIHITNAVDEGYQGVQLIQSTSNGSLIPSSNSQVAETDGLTHLSQTSVPDQSILTTGEDEAETRTTVFVCSTCDQAFESLSQAEQHILSEHCDAGSSAEQDETKDLRLEQTLALDTGIPDENVAVDTVSMDTLSGQFDI